MEDQVKFERYAFRNKLYVVSTENNKGCSELTAGEHFQWTHSLDIKCTSDQYRAGGGDCMALGSPTGLRPLLLPPAPPPPLTVYIPPSHRSTVGQQQQSGGNGNSKAPLIQFLGPVEEGGRDRGDDSPLDDDPRPPPCPRNGPRRQVHEMGTRSNPAVQLLEVEERKEKERGDPARRCSPLVCGAEQGHRPRGASRYEQIRDEQFLPPRPPSSSTSSNQGQDFLLIDDIFF